MDKLVLLPSLDHPPSAQNQSVSWTGKQRQEGLWSTFSPVGSQLAGDVQHVHHPLQLQLPTAYRRGDEAAGPADPGAGEGRGLWVTGSG